MAVIQQVAFIIPDDILEGLSSGELIQYGGVIRDTAGKLVKHLKPIPLSKVKDNKILIIGLGVVVASATAAIVIALKSKKSKQSVPVKIPKCVEDYNASFCTYLEAASSGNLGIEHINRLITDLDIIRENNDSGKINIEFSTEQLKTLVNLVFDYTKNLAEANSFKTNEIKEPIFISADATIIDLQGYLKIQKQIFEKVS